ncbi:Aspartate aminotransferase [invertebrate metagenome]|uniref:Aspartate aminotransferase n=1 Tax=invertebrate metagenome TaxID=1711999 RepID=A0A2H9T8N0_9ZZZZ
MTRILSDRVQSIKPSSTLAVTAKANALRKKGRNIISLGAGEPDFDTPAHIKAAACQAIADGQTHYTPVDGTPQLKQVIADKFRKDNQLEYSLEQIIVSSGCKQTFFNLVLALLNTGDEVIIPAPYWVSYPDMILIAGGKPVIVSSDMASRFKITPEQLEKAITPKTKLVVLNSPSNPSGVAYSKKELEQLGAVLVQHPDIMIASDDIYEHILWNQEGFCNMAMACPELVDRTIILNGVSKAYAMTGWRIGYAAGPEQLIKAMKKIQSQSTSNPCSIAQAAALEAISGNQDCVQTLCQTFKKRHDFVYERLNDIKGVKVIPCDGTFYTFPDFNGPMKTHHIESDSQLASTLLEQGVALVPGSAFGAPGHLRLSFTLEITQLETAMDCLQKALG